jgi:hypothetical protein
MHIPATHKNHIARSFDATIILRCGYGFCKIFYGGMKVQPGEYRRKTGDDKNHE